MEVLLLQDVEKLGRLGDVVEVADGYARNYLLPKKIASWVTPENLQRIDLARQARQRREQEELDRVGRQAEMLEGFLCYITARATETGHLFGSVSSQQIADQLVENGFEGTRASNIDLDRPIEEVGDYEVEVMLHPQVRAKILVRVAAEQEEEE
ncbi:MAG: 50S ribosomal protein L9 [Candidatus Brocadiae bacterium]|nr:50S ribosomal protein L9 [Candidatus Brocadiia bacterium]